MGAIITCQKCKNTNRYDSGEINNIGTIWHPIWAVECSNCGALLKSDQGERELLDNTKISPIKNGVKIETYTKQTGYERAEKGDIREYWAQEYVKDNYKKLGFSKIEGPLKVGPDFRGVYKGKKVVIEVERAWWFFLDHRHHLNSKFKDVSVLIVLTSDEPPKNMMKELPKKIIHIDIDDFVKWWRPRAKTYAKKKRHQGIIELIAHEFQKRFVTDCDEKERDMSTCPNCDLCPCFGEASAYEASSIFQEMALKFIALYEYPITSEDFSLSTIKPLKIDKFYNKFLSI